MTEAGPLELLSEDEGVSDKEDIRLPGVRKGTQFWWSSALFGHTVLHDVMC